MATLKETKARIASVRSTLKITSAMKLVASAKLRKAQQAAENCAVYERELEAILSAIAVGGRGAVESAAEASGKIAIVALSSNTSLCGGFNVNVIKKAREVIHEYGSERVTVYAIGHKVAEALAKDGLRSVRDLDGLSARPAYAEAATLADELVEGFRSGLFSKVVLVWNHFVSTASQKPTVETYLPFRLESAQSFASVEDLLAEYLIEPDLEALYDELLPKTMRLRIYSLLLDSAAAEHAARTVAMQTATDNGNEILEELTLEYNKGRQAKITAEILDLAGGQI